MVYVGDVARGEHGCFLCDAADEQRSSPHVVERTSATVTVLNRYPYSSGHVLVAPRRHAVDLEDLSPDERAALFDAATRGLRALRAAMGPEGFNVGVNLGAVAGASIEHVHVHVVPRWGGDTNFMPVIGDVKVLPEHLEATAEKLRDAYATLGSG
jgi:ATP adenylyltransferase